LSAIKARLPELLDALINTGMHPVRSRIRVDLDHLNSNRSAKLPFRIHLLPHWQALFINSPASVEKTPPRRRAAAAVFREVEALRRRPCTEVDD
jgi:hypothetical protein